MAGVTGRRSTAHGLAALGGGALVAASLPPWGWWPLAFVGLAVLDGLLADQPARTRFARTWLFSVGWLAPGMGWMWYLTAPGYVVAVALFACLHGAAGAIAPAGRQRWYALPAALTVAEAVRFSFPFGGVPLASLAIAQVDGPLAALGGVGGALLITFFTAFVGCNMAAVARQRFPVAPTVLSVSLGAIVLAAVAPSGTAVDEIRVAFVQGGGPQGTRAINTDPRDVFDRHLAATRTVDVADGVDLVLWPENVIDVPDFETSEEYRLVADEAQRLDAPVLVGVTEDTTDDRFINSQMVVLPDGTIADRYDKVRRVPFGEYMPLRGLLRSLGAPVDQVPRDAVAGDNPAYLDTPVARLAVVISWEVFFGGRANDGVSRGGQVLINPTNGSSYTGTILQSQQVAASRLRARETGRWLVQVSPTGFSAFVDNTGAVDQRTEVSEQAVRIRAVALRTGDTWYVTLGNRPFIALAVLLLALALWRSRRALRAAEPPPPGGRGPRRPVSVDVDDDSDGAVVDQVYGHLGAEAPRRHLGPEPA
jgi:apolipoprotein N-acyltransferase